MKKLYLMLLLVFVIGCKARNVEEVQTTTNTSNATDNINVEMELQTEACNAAYNAGTCDTRLVEIGIITPEECCRRLGRCCV